MNRATTGNGRHADPLDDLTSARLAVRVARTRKALADEVARRLPPEWREAELQARTDGEAGLRRWLASEHTRLFKRENEAGRRRFKELKEALQQALAEPPDAAGVDADDHGPRPPEFGTDPRPISADLLAIPEFPDAMIPGPLRDWIRDIADRGCFPIEYPAAAAMVALASVIGRKLAIRPKRHDDWLVVPNLWGAIVGPPGLQKSPAIEEAHRPLNRMAAEAIEAHKAAMAGYEAEILVIKAKGKAARDALEKAAKKKAPDAELEALARDAAAEMDRTPPIMRRLIINDATVEKIGELLAENPNGLLQFRDELVGFLKTMERQGHEGDRGFYLESWNGFGAPYVYDRIGRGTIIIPNVCLSIFGGIQPGPLARYLRGSANGEEADGLMSRFQVLVYPDPPAEFVNIDRYPDTDAKNRAYDVFKKIDAFDPRRQGDIPVDQARDLPFLGFCPEAQELFDEWRTGLEIRLRSGVYSPLMQCHLSKYRSLMPALALQFHLVEAIGCDSELVAVSVEAAERSRDWCDLLEAHVRRIYQSALDGDPTGAIQLAERLKQSLPNPFTCRQVAQKGWSGLDHVEDVRRAVGILEDRGWLKVVEIPPGPRGGRPSEQVWIHPGVIGGTRADGGAA